MNLDQTLLKKIPLFKEIAPEDFHQLFSHVKAHTEQFKRGEFIFLSGSRIDAFGIILSGHVQIIKEDVFGNRVLLSDLRTPEVFGESFVCSNNYTLTISAQVIEDACILFFPFKPVLHVCHNACEFHNILIRNIVEMIAIKNIKLLEKLEVSTKHSLREKILTYLSLLSQEQKTKTLISPLNRISLADFLGVNRSSLTRELNQMQDEGLLSYSKNTYTLLRFEDI